MTLRRCVPSEFAKLLGLSSKRAVAEHPALHSTGDGVDIARVHKAPVAVEIALHRGDIVQRRQAHLLARSLPVAVAEANGVQPAYQVLRLRAIRHVLREARNDALLLQLAP
eukprot:10739288-Alexandrium_andersonii.AAC.1